MDKNSKSTTNVKDSPTIASFLDAAILASGKTNTALAKELGYNSINIISMFRSGKTHLPINKVGAFAAALDIDELELLRLILKERFPEVFDIINRRCTPLSPEEMEIIREHRSRKKIKN